MDEGAGHPDEQLDEPLKRTSAGASAKKLAEYLGLETVGDLLRHYPRRYLSLNELTPMADLPLDQAVTMVGEVRDVNSRFMKARRGKVMNVVVGDDKGQTLGLTFFNRTEFHMKNLKVGVRAVFTGKVSIYRGHRQLTHPEYELLEGEGGLGIFTMGEGIREVVPIYRASEKGKLPSAAVRRNIFTVLDTLEDLPDPIPVEVRARHGLMDLRTAFTQIHRPDSRLSADQARYRLTFEEAFVLQTALARRRLAAGQLPAVPRMAVPGGLVEALDARLPFTLTQGQQEVGRAIEQELARSHPMHRLLQGEVGSGKTVVALRAMLAVVDSGGQAALLAPTEVLAAQHHRSISAMLGELALGGPAGGLLGGGPGTRVTLLTGSLNTAQRRRALLEAASGEAGIVIGTHALLAESVQFAELGLVVVDEQHRFGVEQRDVLRAKGLGGVPHLLVMTATPIPRTVAMTVFGDLEVSTLTELPAGRSPIHTHVVADQDPKWVQRMWSRVREEAGKGHQSFVVCSRIGDPADPDAPEDADFGDVWADVEQAPENGPDEMDLELIEQGERRPPGSRAGTPRRPARSAVETLELLRNREELTGLSIELLHGRLPAEERDDVMRRFAGGQVQVLVATTVVEVGVDVPNATVMVIVDADRFGVSQLHQLRGRIGRGSAAGLCLMTTELLPGHPGRVRLEAVAGTVDGFELARVDLEHRKEGDVLGRAQSGAQSSLTLLSVLRDEKVIDDARQEAVALVESDPQLEGQPALLRAIRAWVDEDREAFLERG